MAFDTPVGVLQEIVPGGGLKLIPGNSCVNVTAVAGPEVKAPESAELGKKLAETELMLTGASAAA